MTRSDKADDWYDLWRRANLAGCHGSHSDWELQIPPDNISIKLSGSAMAVFERICNDFW